MGGSNDHFTRKTHLIDFLLLSIHVQFLYNLMATLYSQLVRAIYLS